MSSGPKPGLVIVASGRGTRLGSELPKQYLALGNSSVLAHSLGVALSSPAIGRIAVVIHEDDRHFFDAAVAVLGASGSRIVVAHGGSQRQQSVHHGLEALAADGLDRSAIVLVHDAARPFLTEALMMRGIAAAEESRAAIPVLAVTDTVKTVDPHGRVVSTLDREVLRTVQTPQCFEFGLLLDAHRSAARGSDPSFTDDAGLVEWAGHPVTTFEGDPSLFKITNAGDMMKAQQHLTNGRRATTRVATGYDVHALGDGDHVWLCGVKIAHTRGLIGHSDADPALHALTDAILGAISDGDIGSHFPPSDMKWKGAASHIFLKHAVDLVTAKSGSIVHLDATIICEEPKIGPHRDAMRKRIAEITGNDIADISVKATTSEQLGFTGRREGIAAIGTATILL